MTERAARQSRIDRNGVSFQAEKDINAMFRPLSRAVGASVRRHAGEAIDPLAYVLIMRDVDSALAGITGRFHGDTAAPLYRAVVDRCREVRKLAFTRAVEDVMRRLRRAPEVLRAIEREVGE